jgi:hypothetical protein
MLQKYMSCRRLILNFIVTYLSMSGVVDLSVMSVNRISVRSKPASLRGGNSIQLTVPLLNAAY